MISRLLGTNDEDKTASNTQAKYDRSMVERKTGIMDLPPEIRAIIIRAVLGDRKVHVHYPKHVKKGVHVPRFSFCDLEDQKRFLLQGASNAFSTNYVKAHALCYASPGYSTQQSPTTLACFEDWLYHREVDRRDLYFDHQLPLMTVSKQLREEAIEAFYSTNVFSIADFTSFKTFMERTMPDRAHLIRTLELSTTMDAMTWKRGFADSYGQSVQEWRLDRHQRRKLSHVSHITIRLCDMDPNRFPPEDQHILRSFRAKHMNRTLRAGFGTWQKLESLGRVDVHICCEPRYVVPVQAATGQPEMDDGEMREIGRGFAAEILRREEKQG